MSGEAVAALAVGLAFLLPAFWIWRWPVSWWARIEQHDANSPSVVYQPFTALRTVPSFLGSIWFGVFVWGTFLDRIAPHLLDRLPLPLGFTVLAWPFLV